MLDYIRFALYTALLVIVFFLYQAWVKEHPPAAAATVESAPVSGTYIPQPTASTSSTEASAQASTATTSSELTPPSQTGQLVQVTTDLLNVTIDTRGGDIVAAKLLDYPESLNEKAPFVLLNNNKETRYIAESGLLSKQGPDTQEAQALYTVAQSQYVLATGEKDLVVKLVWQNNNITVTKFYTFTRGSYEIKVGYELANHSSQPWQGNLYSQLLRTNTPPTNNSGFVNLATYFGAAISTPDKPFEKITFKDMKEQNVSKQTKNGWAAMIQHYFVTAWVPPQETTSTYYSRVTKDGLYTIGMMGAPFTVAPAATLTTETKLYVGPAIADLLEHTAPGLKLTIDYGWFWFISVIIFWMLQKIYDFIGNWGWSIVLVTVVIKLMFYHLSAKSYRSMSMLKKLQPRIESLKQRFGDDKQKLTQATLDLYRQEKVNPMSGCLPILIQIPVFIALYWVLVESVQLRQAPFILWIHDLSQHDPYYVLPILMGISMFIQQRLNPPPPDPMQAKVMMAMPIIFTVLFANFPAGLMLYWFVNNTLSFLQQWHVMRSINREGNVSAK